MAVQISFSKFEYVGGLHHCSNYDRCELWYCLLRIHPIFSKEQNNRHASYKKVEDRKYDVEFEFPFALHGLKDRDWTL